MHWIAQDVQQKGQDNKQKGKTEIEQKKRTNKKQTENLTVSTHSKYKSQMALQPSDKMLNISCEVTEWINLIDTKLKPIRA